MTEDDAKTSPCVGPRPELTGEPIAGVRPGSVAMWACRGSACKMAWRWTDEEAGQGYCGLTRTPDA